MTATRSSSQTSFLQASMDNTLLQVYQRTLANKILFSTQKVASGVSVSTAGRSCTISARKEVILATGAFRSPQLLIVSSIGSSAILKRLKIPVLSSLSGVGQNLEDQPLFGLTLKVNVTTVSQLTSNASFYAASMSEYLTSQSSPMSIFGGNVVGWAKIPSHERQKLSNQTVAALSQFPADWPELELLPVSGTLAAVSKSDTSNYLTLSVALLTATSRGNATINSTDTMENPIVSPNWL